MRLWHYKLIPFLPKSQLLAQWRELNSIFKNQPRHILINYIYDYPKRSLYIYSVQLINEMRERGYRIKSLKNFQRYFQDYVDRVGSNHAWLFMPSLQNPFPDHHDSEYLVICYYNLLEKYIRGQKDFGGEEMDAIAKVCDPYLKNPYIDYEEESE